MMKKSLIAPLTAASMAIAAIIAPAIVTPAAAEVDVNLSIGTPPPAPVYEAVPAPRAGYVWAPGFWRWENARHVWAPGRWVAERPGYHFVPDRWERAVENGRENWRYRTSSWDRDGDGIPDRYDSHPNNPYRR